MIAYVHKFSIIDYLILGKKKFIRVHPKSITKMKEKVKLLTCRSNGWEMRGEKKHLDSTLLVG